MPELFLPVPSWCCTRSARWSHKTADLRTGECPRIEAAFLRILGRIGWWSEIWRWERSSKSWISKCVLRVILYKTLRSVCTKINLSSTCTSFVTFINRWKYRTELPREPGKDRTNHYLFCYYIKFIFHRRRTSLRICDCVEQWESVIGFAILNNI
jgi:hypothetical protein